MSVDRAQRQVTVAHQQIPGYMPGMTMPFTVKDDWALSALAPGQILRATLVVDREQSWLEEISIVQEPSPGEAGGQPSAGRVEPEPGTKIPDFRLVNQDGVRIHLAGYRGKLLLLTFIYTRCPLPDYCPRVGANFSRICTSLKWDPLLEDRLRLLSVSFDTEFDTPEVLKDYGNIFSGCDASGAFRHWGFASGTAEEIKNLALFFGLDYWKDAGQIVHNLRTALIGPDGRLIRLYRGSAWTPEEVIAQIRQTAKTSGL
jgi:protein SCO1/2